MVVMMIIIIKLYSVSDTIMKLLLQGHFDSFSFMYFIVYYSVQCVKCIQ